jgi:anti-sigma B factor antagonist
MAKDNSPIQQIRWQDQTAIVDVGGEVDLHCSAAFQQELLETLDEGPKRVVVNLADVGYMDSSGVASLVKLLSRSRSAGVELCLLSPTPKVLSVLQITRLDSVFEICDSEEEATA